MDMTEEVDTLGIEITPHLWLKIKALVKFYLILPLLTSIAKRRWS